MVALAESNEPRTNGMVLESPRGASGWRGVGDGGASFGSGDPFGGGEVGGEEGWGE